MVTQHTRVAVNAEHIPDNKLTENAMSSGFFEIKLATQVNILPINKN